MQLFMGLNLSHKDVSVAFGSLYWYRSLLLSGSCLWSLVFLFFCCCQGLFSDLLFWSYYRTSTSVLILSMYSNYSSYVLSFSGESLDVLYLFYCGSTSLVAPTLSVSLVPISSPGATPRGKPRTICR